MKAYLVAESAALDLVCNEVTTEHPLREPGYEYHISPFYASMQAFCWISPHIFSSNISANLLDPLQFHEEDMGMFLVSDRFSEYWSVRKRKAVSMLTSMHSFAYHNHLMEMLSENIVNAVLPPFQV